MRIHTFFVFLFLSLPFLSFAAPTLRDEVERDIEKFHFQAAEAKLEGLPAAEKAFYTANILVYKYAATQDPQYMKAFEEGWEQNLKDIETLPESDPHRGIFLAELHGKKGVLYFLQESYTSAMMSMRTCHQLVKKNEKNFPNHASNLKLLGLFNVTFAAVPKKYQWITNALGFSGNLSLGIKQLQKAALSGDVMRMEATFIAYYGEKNMQANPSGAIQRLLNERKIMGESIVLDYFIASAYFAMNKNEKALEILQQREKYAQDEEVFFIPFWDYLLGKSYYFKEDYTQTISTLSLFKKNHTGKMYQCDAAFRVGMAYLLSGDYNNAKNWFTTATVHPRSGFDEDEYAYKTSKSFLERRPTQITVNLFRARNLYDGGYFGKSIAVLEKIKNSRSSLSANEQTELHYRLGRVYQAQQDFTLAKTHYLLCIEQKSGSASAYMQPYSCYYIGEILKAQGFVNEAKVYYKKALAYDGYSYQSGLESRVKTALGTL